MVFDFAESRGWDVKDLQDKTVIVAQDNSCTIELIAARKIKKARKRKAALRRCARAQRR